MSDPDARKPSRRLWMIAALCAVLLHAGGVALAVVETGADDSDGGLGANAIEVGLEMASPQLDPTDLPPGPDTDASVASPAVQEQKAVVKETDLPQDKVNESEDPDRVVTENESKKPKEEEPEKAAVQQTASPEAVAQEATARQTLENAREGATTAAPVLGIGKDIQKLSAQWNRKLSAYFELHKRHPEDPNPKKVTVNVSFSLDRLGHVLSVNVQRSSGNPAYDQAAVDMIKRSDPVPRPPAKLTDDTFSFNLDVQFNPKGRS